MGIRSNFCNTVSDFMPLSLDVDKNIHEDFTGFHNVSPMWEMFFFVGNYRI